MSDNTDQWCISTIRTLAMDAVQAAASGHPGTPMAMAPVAYTLWQRYLRFDPNDLETLSRAFETFHQTAGHDHRFGQCEKLSPRRPREDREKPVIPKPFNSFVLFVSFVERESL